MTWHHKYHLAVYSSLLVTPARFVKEVLLMLLLRCYKIICVIYRLQINHCLRSIKPTSDPQPSILHHDIPLKAVDKQKYLGGNCRS